MPLDELEQFGISEEEVRASSTRLLYLIVFQACAFAKQHLLAVKCTTKGVIML